MIRHVVHDNTTARIIVEVNVGLVTLHLWWGMNSGDVGKPSMASTGALNLSPAAARDRLVLFRALDGLELAGFGALQSATRLVPYDTIHASICNITRRPTA